MSIQMVNLQHGQLLHELVKVPVIGTYQTVEKFLTILEKTDRPLSESTFASDLSNSSGSVLGSNPFAVSSEEGYSPVE